MKAKVFKLALLFTLLNFGALALGSFLMGEGPTAAWYSNLNQAPWTPPGWVFGAAWFTIMLCLTISLTRYFKNNSDTKFTVIYSIHLILNIIWNYFFFNAHMVGAGLIIIVSLTVIVGYMSVYLAKRNLTNGLLLSPYFVWLCIATSLNLYVLIHN